MNYVQHRVIFPVGSTQSQHSDVGYCDLLKPQTRFIGILRTKGNPQTETLLILC